MLTVWSRLNIRTLNADDSDGESLDSLSVSSFGRLSGARGTARW